jgi:predicted ester cyclase
MESMNETKSEYIRRGLLLAMLLISGILVYGQSNNEGKKISKKEEVKMSTTEKNKEVIRKLYEQSMNKRNMELLSEFIADDYIGINGTRGAIGFKESLVALINSFPDAKWNIEELIADGDKVMVRQKFSGTHTAKFQYIEATGKAVSSDGMVIYELKNGKIIRSLVQTDRLGFLQQLEVLPVNLATLSNGQNNKDQVNFIDKFIVPSAAKNEFYERMRVNRNFIKKLPGFVHDAAYEYTDKDGNLTCVTVALWENVEALQKAKDAVQAEYKEQGFDIAEMMKRLNIVSDRGVYKQITDIK